MTGKNGKGHTRRGSTVPAAEAAENWEHALGKKIMPWEANVGDTQKPEDK